MTKKERKEKNGHMAMILCEILNKRNALLL